MTGIGQVDKALGPKMPMRLLTAEGQGIGHRPLGKPGLEVDLTGKHPGGSPITLRRNDPPSLEVELQAPPFPPGDRALIGVLRQGI